MNLTGLIVALLIGAVAGFLAGQIVKGHGFGIVAFWFPVWQLQSSQLADPQ